MMLTGLNAVQQRRRDESRDGTLEKDMVDQHSQQVQSNAPQNYLGKWQT